MINPYYNWKIKFNLKNREKIDDLVSVLRSAGKVLVLCENKTSDVMAFISDIRTLLPKAKISTWIFNKLDEENKTRNNGIKESEIKKVRSKKYDFIVDLTEFDEVPWLYFVSNINTKVAMGIIENDLLGIYNLKVNPVNRSNKDYKILIDYLRSFVSV